MKYKQTVWAALVVISGVFAAPVQDAGDRYYEAIRNNDIAAIRELIKESGANIADKRGTTPLMYAAATGSVEAMRLLVDAGADVNAKSAFDVTALMWSVSDPAKVKLLLANGAKVNAQSKAGRTPLMLAAMGSNSHDVVKMLLDAGADASVKDSMNTTVLHAASFGGDVETVEAILARGADVNAKDAVSLTPLHYAVAVNDLRSAKILVAKGADVNAVTAPEINQRVKNGAITIGNLTPLMLAAPYGGPEMVGLLLKAGAKVNVKDVRGMTPLMLAVATDRPSAEVVRMLVEKGADSKLMSKEGETVFDWELKFRNPQIMSALGMDASAITKNGKVNVNVKQGAPNAQAALGRSLEILGRTAGGFFKEGGCGACHAQNLTGMAAGIAAQHGVPIPAAVFEESNKGTKLGWSSFEQPLMQRMDPPGGPSMISYTLLQLAAGRATADRTTDAMVFNLAASQKADGRWGFLAVARAPMQDGDFGTTALALRSIQLYGAPGRKAEFADRVGRAAAWLASAKPETTEDRVMQVLGLKWAGGYDDKVAKLAAELAAGEREDGGWAQTPYLKSDAYATGQTLYALYEAGMPASDAVFKRGVAFLVRSQAEDGTWHVAARATKVQPYFQSGFPYAHDQWISNAATAWAAMALSLAEVEKPSMASVR